MILKSLELQGFKTFPDKTTLQFERGITSVVGPNGSGKSNISDAMRWVLGEQSVRTLRCSKMEDVIFNGTPQRKALGFAEVTLTIDNADRRLPFAGDTVAVTRRYYRSGESEYLINKSTVRLKDINELFMDTGLGRDGYSIIGQGKIDSIVAARSEDRREIFEEAAGISRYRYRKEESERRLNKAEENLVRLRDILSELESRVEPLRIQAEKAEQFIAFDREKRELEIGIWMETLDRSGKLLREHGEKISLAQAQHEGLQEELQAIAVKTEENYRRTNQCTVDMEEARGQAADLDGEAVRAEGEASLFENDAAHTRESIQRLEGQITEASRSGGGYGPGDPRETPGDKREGAADPGEPGQDAHLYPALGGAAPGGGRGHSSDGAGRPGAGPGQRLPGRGTHQALVHPVLHGRDSAAGRSGCGQRQAGQPALGRCPGGSGPAQRDAGGCRASRGCQG